MIIRYNEKLCLIFPDNNARSAAWHLIGLSAQSAAENPVIAEITALIYGCAL